MFKLSIAATLFITATSHAQVSPQSFFHTFSAKSRPVTNIEVYNHYTDRSVKVEIKSAKVMQPGEKDEKLDFKKGLIVSPKSFSLSAKPKGDNPAKKSGYVRTVRLLMKKKPKDIEEVYRVTFSPESFTGNLEFKAQNKNQKGIKVDVLIGSGMLIFAEPLNVKRSISWTKVGSKYTFKNTGNAHVLLTFCQMNQDCKESKDGGRLYAGKEKSYVSKSGKFKVLRELDAGIFETLVVSSSKGEKVFVK